MCGFVAVKSTLARFGRTPPTRARRPFDASVDPTDTRILRAMASPSDSSALSKGTYFGSNLFTTVAELLEAVREFNLIYNERWLIARHVFASAQQVRLDSLAASECLNAGPTCRRVG
jgi:hypothetical protein